MIKKGVAGARLRWPTDPGFNRHPQAGVAEDAFQQAAEARFGDSAISRWTSLSCGSGRSSRFRRFPGAASRYVRGRQLDGVLSSARALPAIAAGEQGVAHVLDLIASEMEVAMTLTGARAVGAISRGSLVAEPPPRARLTSVT